MAEQKNFINMKIAVIVCKKKNAVSAKGIQRQAWISEWQRAVSR